MLEVTMTLCFREDNHYDALKKFHAMIQGQASQPGDIPWRVFG